MSTIDTNEKPMTQRDKSIIIFIFLLLIIALFIMLFWTKSIYQTQQKILAVICSSVK